MIELKFCPVVTQSLQPKLFYRGRFNLKLAYKTSPTHFLTRECENKRSHRLFMVLDISCQWKLKGSCQSNFRLRVAFSCALEDPSNSIGCLNWYPGADIEQGAVMKPQRFLILVQEHLDHNLWKCRSCCSCALCWPSSPWQHTDCQNPPGAVSSCQYHLCLLKAEWPDHLISGLLGNGEQERSLRIFGHKQNPQRPLNPATVAGTLCDPQSCCAVAYWCSVCLWAAGLWLSETLDGVEQLQPQQPSQPGFSSQDQEPLPGELWPRELGLMNCFSIQIWHHISLLSPWLPPSLAPVLTFILLTLPIPCRKRIWEWAAEEGKSWSPSAPFSNASPPQIWQQQMSKARVLVNIRCCRFVLVLVSFLWLQLLHF